MKLIIGLGNPGSEYLNNRHNVGFMALDNLYAHYLFENWRTKLGGLFSTASLGSEKILLVKPQTFMNLSGNCVAKFKQFFKINVADIFVIYDDISISENIPEGLSAEVEGVNHFHQLKVHYPINTNAFQKAYPSLYYAFSGISKLSAKVHRDWLQRMIRRKV